MKKDIDWEFIVMSTFVFLGLMSIVGLIAFELYLKYLTKIAGV